LTSGDNITLINNEGFGNGDSSILIGGVSNVWVDRFYSHDEDRMGIIVATGTNIKITNSIIYNAGYHQLTVGDTSGQARPLTNFEAYNNVIIFGPDSTNAILDITSGPFGVIFKNNIITTTQHTTPRNYLRYLTGATPENTGSEFSHNIWWRPDGGLEADNRHWYSDGNNQVLFRFNIWQGLFPEEKYVDPQIANPLNNDFRLKTGSPAIDAGIDVGLTEDFEGKPVPQGSAPDIGALEYAG